MKQENTRLEAKLSADKDFKQLNQLQLSNERLRIDLDKAKKARLSLFDDFVSIATAMFYENYNCHSNLYSTPQQTMLS